MCNFFIGILQRFTTSTNEELTENRKQLQLSLQTLLGIKPMLAMCIVTNTILKYPLILVQTDLLNKIQNIKTIPIDLNSTIVLSLINSKRLELFIQSSEGPLWRIEKLCKMFSISENRACELLGSRPFLLTKDFNHLETYMKLFEDIGISKEDMLKDMWIFKYSESFLSKRFKILREQGVKKIKTWMIRCPEETLLKHIQRVTQNQNILGENSAAEYLSAKLDCTESVVNFIINKHKQLKTTSVLKLCQTIDFLYKYGFTSKQICGVPKILLHSTKTTEKRIKEL
ncbi:hypothetical protein GWI33_000524, partial [Rhynchophorus ferrugineus]